MHTLKAHYWFATGKAMYKNTANEVMLAGDACINLIEDCTGMSKRAVLEREGYLTSIFPNCTNEYVAGRSRQQWAKDSGQLDHVHCACCGCKVQKRYWKQHEKTGKHKAKKSSNA
jgi:hypothetical protein